MSTNAEVPRAWATEAVDLVDADPTWPARGGPWPRQRSACRCVGCRSDPHGPPHPDGLHFKMTPGVRTPRGRRHRPCGCGCGSGIQAVHPRVRTLRRGRRFGPSGPPSAMQPGSYRIGSATAANRDKTAPSYPGRVRCGVHAPHSPVPAASTESEPNDPDF